MCVDNLPDFRQPQNEAGQDRSARYRLRLFEAFHFLLRAINVNLLRLRIDQPAQPRALFDVLAHFLLQNRQPIRLAP